MWRFTGCIVAVLVLRQGGARAFVATHCGMRPLILSCSLLVAQWTQTRPCSCPRNDNTACHVTPIRDLQIAPRIPRRQELLRAALHRLGRHHSGSSGLPA